MVRPSRPFLPLNHMEKGEQDRPMTLATALSAGAAPAASFLGGAALAVRRRAPTPSC